MILIQPCHVSKIYLLVALTFLVLAVREVVNPDTSNRDSAVGRILASSAADLCDGVDFEDDVEKKSTGDDATNSAIDYFNDVKGNDNKLKKALDKDKDYDTKDYLQDMIPYVLPWAILAIISLVGWFFYCSIVCCPCPKCCKGKKKYTRAQKIWPAIVLAFLSVITLGIGMAGTIVGANFIPHVKLTECAIAQFSDRFQNGKDKWIGTKAARNFLSQISDGMDSFNQSVQDTYGNTASSAWLTDDSTFLDTKLSGIATTYPSMTVSDPRDKTASLTLFQSSTNIVWGPVATSATMTNWIQQEKEAVLNPVVTAMGNIRDVSLDTQLKTESIQTSIQNGRNEMDTFITQLDDMQDDVLNNIEQGNNYMDLIGIILLAIFGLCIVVSCFSIAGVLFVSVCGVKKFRICNHCAWVWSSLLMVLLFVLATILIPFGVMFTDFCEIFDDILANRDEIDKYEIFEDVATRFKVCLHGDGDLTTDFLGDSLAFAQQLEDHKQALEQVRTLVSGYNGFVTISGQSANATGKTINQEYLNVAYYDVMRKAWWAADTDGSSGADYPSDSSQTVYDELVSFNSYISTGTNFPTCGSINDRWAFDSSTCPSSHTYANNNASTTGNHCLVFADWTATQYNTRYSGCGEVTSSQTRFDNIKSYYQSWETNELVISTELRIDTGNTNDSQKSYQERAKAFVEDINGTSQDPTKKGNLDEVDEFYTDITALLTLITDKLLPGLNCSFLQSTFDDLEYALCDRLIPTAFQVAICSAIGGIVLILSTIVNIFAVKRFGKQTKEILEF
mmetsp:Transcript_15120/g.16815  ORF Transcript_15120/g.16815 Transcript_15120/m.16815 type:complete len:789 (-) Transcript_15120:216-2582(-)